MTLKTDNATLTAEVDNAVETTLETLSLEELQSVGGGAEIVNLT